MFPFDVNELFNVKKKIQFLEKCKIVKFEPQINPKWFALGIECPVFNFVLEENTTQKEEKAKSKLLILSYQK